MELCVLHLEDFVVRLKSPREVGDQSPFSTVYCLNNFISIFMRLVSLDASEGIRSPGNGW